MNIDLGYLGKVVLEDLTETGGQFVFDEITFVMEGATEMGIRVYGVIDNRSYAIYPCCWRNAILIKL